MLIVSDGYAVHIPPWERGKAVHTAAARLALRCRKERLSSKPWKDPGEQLQGPHNAPLGKWTGAFVDMRGSGLIVRYGAETESWLQGIATEAKLLLAPKGRTIN